MTGNTNKWRAPLAGLASLAMVATMGVAATTANAAVRETHTVTFSINNKTYDVSVKNGASVADTLHRHTLNGTGGAKTITGVDYTNFAGWQDFSFDDPVYTTKTVKAITPNDVSKDAVKVTYSQYGTVGLINAPEGAQTPATGVSYYIPVGSDLSKRAPLDVVDNNQVVLNWKVQRFYANGKPASTATTEADLSKVDTTTAAGQTIQLTPNFVAAKTVKITGDVNGYVIGAYADGTPDDTYEFDVANGQTVKLPKYWVNKDGNATDPFVTPAKLQYGAVKYDFGGDYTGNGAVGVELTPSYETSQSGYSVTFKDANGNEIKTYRATEDSDKDLKGKFLTAADRENISTITIPNFYVKGWKADVPANITDTDTGRAFTNSEGLSYHLFTSADLDHASFTGNVIFTPVQGGTTGTVKITFRDTNYVGKHDTVVVDAKGGEYLSSDKFPSWTRDGYVFVRWVLSDANGNPIKADGTSAHNVNDKVEFNSDKLVGEFGSPFQNNFTVVAVWGKVDATVLDAALKYITPSTADAYFTSETAGNFKTVYNNVVKERTQLINASTDNKVSDADAAKLVAELKAGWEQLKFDAKGNPTISALDPRKNSFVFRLHKGGLRLYSQTPSEIYAAQRTGWTVDNGYLFRAASKDAQKSTEINSLKDFKAAAQATGLTGKPADELASKLDAIADPIVTVIERYSSPNGADWVYTSNTTEMKSLDRGGWSHEGVAFVVPTFGGTTVVRFAKNGQHLMSTGATEQASLVRNGWTREGVAFRGL